MLIKVALLFSLLAVQTQEYTVYKAADGYCYASDGTRTHLVYEGKCTVGDHVKAYFLRDEEHTLLKVEASQ